TPPAPMLVTPVWPLVPVRITRPWPVSTVPVPLIVLLNVIVLVRLMASLPLSVIRLSDEIEPVVPSSPAKDRSPIPSVSPVLMVVVPVYVWSQDSSCSKLVPATVNASVPLPFSITPEKSQNELVPVTVKVGVPALVVTLPTPLLPPPRPPQ